MALGSGPDVGAQFLGRRVSYTYEMAELVVGVRRVMLTADGPFPTGTTYSWEPPATASSGRCGARRATT